MTDFVARLLRQPGPRLRPLPPHVFDPAAPRLRGDRTPRERRRPGTAAAPTTTAPDPGPAAAARHSATGSLRQREHAPSVAAGEGRAAAARTTDGGGDPLAACPRTAGRRGRADATPAGPGADASTTTGETSQALDHGRTAARRGGEGRGRAVNAPPRDGGPADSGSPAPPSAAAVHPPVGQGVTRPVRPSNDSAAGRLGRRPDGRGHGVERDARTGSQGRPAAGDPVEDSAAPEAVVAPVLPAVAPSAPARPDSAPFAATASSSTFPAVGRTGADNEASAGTGSRRPARAAHADHETPDTDRPPVTPAGTAGLPGGGTTPPTPADLRPGGRSPHAATPASGDGGFPGRGPASAAHRPTATEPPPAPRRPAATLEPATLSGRPLVPPEAGAASLRPRSPALPAWPAPTLPGPAEVPPPTDAPPSVARPVAERALDSSAPGTVVRITIDRLDVRTIAPPSAERPGPRRLPRLSLDAYLSGRRS